MPKHCWKWRTEQVRKLNINELDEMLRDLLTCRVSSRMARYIYENCVPDPDENGLRISALRRIADNEDAPWARSFLWRELEKHKAEPFGDWCVVALAWNCPNDFDSAMRFIRLYEDESAHLDTRGSAIYGIYSSLPFSDQRADGRFARAMDRIRATCAKALSDQANPYARAGACWLAQRLGGFEKELAVLAEDRTPIFPGASQTVADHVD
jgi:hypothetical protein